MKTQGTILPSARPAHPPSEWPPAEAEARAIPAMLRNIHILAGLDEDALRLLSERAQENQIPAGGIVVREGEAGNRFFLVADGLVKVCRQFGQADQVELARFGPGDFFGEMCILETLPRSATVQAVNDTILYSLTSLTFYHLYEAMPRQHSILVTNIARDLSRRLRHLDEVFAAQLIQVT